MTARPAATGPVRAAGPRLDLLVIAGIVVLVLLVLGYVLSQRQQTLRSSPVGMDGLQIWLTKGGIPAQTFTGGWLVDPERIGLLIVPLHDTDLVRDRIPARTKEELLRQEDELDQPILPLSAKAEAVPALIVLPKWRSGMRLTGIAHPDLLVNAAKVESVLDSLTGQFAARLVRDMPDAPVLSYIDAEGVERRASLYAPQLLQTGSCTQIIGSGDLSLLARCPLYSWGDATEVLILSDPDLLNNHGLRLGDNALIARDLLGELAAGGSVMIDLSEDNWLAEDAIFATRDRTWADLLRFFQPPFLALWLAGGALLALVLWRSLRRAGPVLPVTAQGSAKLQAIAARARLMRLTGQDGAMLGDYARARLAATAARLVGPGQARQLAEEGAFLRFIARRDAALAPRLEAALSRLHALPRSVPASLAIHHVEELEQILEQITHEP